MTTVTKKQARLGLGQFSAPYGNAFREKYTFQTSSSGVFADSDVATAIQSGDVVRLGLGLFDVCPARNEAG